MVRLRRSTWRNPQQISFWRAAATSDMFRAPASRPAASIISCDMKSPFHRAGAILNRPRALLPGVTVSATVAMAASFLSQHYGAPAMLFALLLGLALSAISEADNSFQAGLDFVSSTLLRVGVALLGVRIALDQILSLGIAVLIGILVLVALTIGAGVLFARALRLDSTFGVLTGGAVAICGAAAAAALAAALPETKTRGRELLITVFGVTTLSTVAMVIYPVIARELDLSDVATGIFLGGAIHDVAQVMGAGYGMSPQAGDSATIVKLLRVATLVPVVWLVGHLAHQQTKSRGAWVVPWFLIAFTLLVLMSSVITLPPRAIELATTTSRWLIMAAIAALGMQTSLRSLLSVGCRPFLLILAETVFIGGAVLTFALLTAAA